MQTLRIDRVGGQGDGIADTPSGPVFAPLTLPGETVRAKVTEGRAEGVEIVEASLVKSLTAVYHGRVKYPDQRTA